MLFSEREGKRGRKWLPVSIHCLGKLLRKEGESMHGGKAVWPEEGPYAKKQSIKIISHKEKKLNGMLTDEHELQRDEGD